MLAIRMRNFNTSELLFSVCLLSVEASQLALVASFSSVVSSLASSSAFLFSFGLLPIYSFLLFSCPLFGFSKLSSLLIKTIAALFTKKRRSIFATPHWLQNILIPYPSVFLSHRMQEFISLNFLIRKKYKVFRQTFAVYGVELN